MSSDVPTDVSVQVKTQSRAFLTQDRGRLFPDRIKVTPISLKFPNLTAVGNYLLATGVIDRGAI